VSDTIQNLIPAADGWRALFGHGSAAQRSRIVGWAVVQGENGSEIVGMVVDPNDPGKIVPAPVAVDPETGAFTRYGYAAAK
jgi:hypothetical protein